MDTISTDHPKKYRIGFTHNEIFFEESADFKMYTLPEVREKLKQYYAKNATYIAGISDERLIKEYCRN